MVSVQPISQVGPQRKLREGLVQENQYCSRPATTRGQTNGLVQYRGTNQVKRRHGKVRCGQKKPKTPSTTAKRLHVQKQRNVPLDGALLDDCPPSSLYVSASVKKPLSRELTVCNSNVTICLSLSCRALIGTTQTICAWCEASTVYTPVDMIERRKILSRVVLDPSLGRIRNRNPPVLPQINGNNGEWTGTDDLEESDTVDNLLALARHDRKLVRCDYKVPLSALLKPQTPTTEPRVVRPTVGPLSRVDKPKTVKQNVSTVPPQVTNVSEPKNFLSERRVKLLGMDINMKNLDLIGTSSDNANAMRRLANKKSKVEYGPKHPISSEELKTIESEAPRQAVSNVEIARAEILEKAEIQEIKKAPTVRKVLVMSSKHIDGTSHDYGWDGQQVCHYDKEEDKFVGCTDGAFYDYVDEGTSHDHVVASGAGWFDVSLFGNGKRHKVMAATHDYSEKDEKVGHLYFATIENAIYFDPLVKFLSMTYPHCKITEPLYKAIIASADKHFHEISEILRGESISYFIRCRVKANITSFGRLDVAKAVSGSVGEIELGTLSDLVRLRGAAGVALDLGKPFYDKAVECPVEPDWTFNTDAVIRMKAVGCTFTKDKFEFKTQGTSPREWKMTRFFALVGLCSSFVQYSNSTRNCELAFKRVLSNRDNEVELDSNQLRLAKYLTAHAAPWCSLFTDWNMKKYKRIGKEALSDYPIAETDQSWTHWMLSCMSSMIKLCDSRRVDDCVYSNPNILSWAYYNVYQSFVTNTSMFDQRRACAEIRHIKKKLRQRYVASVLLHEPDDVMVKRMKCCIKNELAKFNKVPRFFVQYEAGCMYANYLPEYTKMCIDGIHHFERDGFDCSVEIMAKPAPGRMDEIFDRILSARLTRNSVYIAVYSDDSVYSGNIEGMPFTFNVDISSCDSGNRELTFLFAELCMRKFSIIEANGLVEQCMKPLRVTNPAETSEYLEVQLDRPYEGSGSVLTTVLNHLASFNIACSFFDKLHTITSLEGVEAAITDSAKLVGHNVTCEGTTTRLGFVAEKIQFLKHSPHECEDGLYRASLNLGCILRGLGSVDGVLEARTIGVTQSEFLTMTHSERMDKFVGGVVAGLVHQPGSIILDRLRDRFPATELPIEQESNSRHAIVYAEDSASHRVKTMSLCRRYECNEYDLETLGSQIDCAKVGQVYGSFATQQIFKVDYGVQPNPLDVKTLFL